MIVLLKLNMTYCFNLCGFSFTDQDNQSPLINNCPSSQSAFVQSGITSFVASWIQPTATDNLDPNPRLLRQTHSPNSPFPLGTTAVTYVFVDEAMNAASCTFFITVYCKFTHFLCPFLLLDSLALLRVYKLFPVLPYFSQFFM